MQEAATKKLNIPEATNFTFCPLQFLGKTKGKAFNPFTEMDGSQLPRAMVKILARIWTEQKCFGKAKIKKTRFAKKCGLAYSVVLEALKKLSDDNLITEKNNVYKIVPKVSGKNYLVIDDYLYDLHIPTTAVLILERIKAFYLEMDENGNFINYDFKNRKPINYFKSSDAGLAAQLNLATSTVSYNVLKLLHAGLLYRWKRLRYKDKNDNNIYKTVQIKGVTGNAPSVFVIPYEVLAVEQRSTYEPQQEDYTVNVDEIEIPEATIEKVYAELREEAEAKHAAALKLAFSDEEFTTARADFGEAFNAAIAAIENGENKQEAKAHMNAAQARYLKRLAELGLSEEELSETPYLCRKCGDTGFTDTGQRCRCRARIKELIISRIFKRK